MLRVISISYFLTNLLIFGFAQKADFQFYTNSDGLASNRIWSIAQDQKGFLWVNTGYLNRFDGYNFINKTSSDSPIFNEHLKGASIHLFGQNLVYLHDQQLIEFNTLSGIKNEISLDTFLPSNYYTHPAFFYKTTYGDGIIPLFGQENKKIILLKYHNGSCSELTSLLNAYIDPDFKSLTICSDSKGNIYYLHKDLKNLIKIDRNGNKIAEIELPIPEIAIHLTAGIDGSILMYGKQKIFQLHEGSENFKPHSLNSQLTSIHSIHDVFQSAEGNIWLTGRDRFLMLIESSSGKLFNFKEELKKIIPNRLDLGNIFMDANGTLWIRTITGLLKVNPQKNWFDTYFTEKLESECGGHCSFRGFAEDQNGNIYASYYTNVFKIDKNGKPFPSPVLPFIQTPFDLLVDNEKLLLNDGFVFDLKANNFSNPYQSENDKKHDLGIYETDNQGIIWRAYRNSLYSLNRNALNPKWEKEVELEGVSAVIITDLEVENDQNILWIGNNTGLLKFNLKTKRLEQENTIKIDKSDVIRYLHLSQNKTLWIGTENGLYKYDKKNQTSKKYTIVDGLSDNYIVTILAEGDSCLWLGTNNGLSRFNYNSETFINFYKEDGIADNEFNRRSAFKASNGRFYFGGTKGITAFYPKEVLQKYQAPLETENLSLISFSKTDAKHDNTIVELFNGEEPFVDIYYQNKTFQFEYSLTDYRFSEKPQYSYQLEGYDDVWSSPTSSNIVKFNSLPSGKYNIRIKALNSKGNWHNHQLKIPLIVHPPWWRSWWAYCSYMIIIGGIIYGVYYFLRRRWALQNELQLEQQEAIRLKELDSFKSRLYTNLTHEFRTPLTVILGMAQQILDSPKNGVDNAAKLIKNNGKSLLRLVNQLLDLSKLEDKSFKLQLQQSDIIPYVRYVTESFQTYANGQNLSLRFFSTLRSLEMEFDPEQLKQVLTNLISNAIKFSESGGEVRVEVEFIKPKLLQIAVSDTGIGIPQADLLHIFDRFFQVDNSTTRAGEGTGIGLAHSSELVKLMNGSIVVESELNKGSIFKVMIPIKQSNINATSPPPIISPGPLDLIPDNSNYGSQNLTSSPLDESAERVLIIEDNADVVEYLKSCLASQFHLDVAYNGQIGLDKALETIPDLIISDVMMPEKDGYEVCDFLKNDERTSHIPIILLTAKADAASKIAGLKRGADAYLAKPFDKEELIVRLEKLSELRKKLKERYAGLIGDNFPKVADMEETSSIEDAFFQKVLKIVEVNYTEEDFSLPQLCQQIGMSRSQLFRKMKALMDISPSEFIRDFRLQKARHLLLNEGLNVSEAAYETGFKDPSYFSKLYQEKFGEAPSESRK